LVSLLSGTLEFTSVSLYPPSPRKPRSVIDLSLVSVVLLARQIKSDPCDQLSVPATSVSTTS
jgi:hypothetical protein